MSDYLLSIDQGTSSSRAIVFDRLGAVVAVRQKELPLITPQDGWVEQDPETLLNDILWAISSVTDDLGRDALRIAAAGITNQRETTLLWDRKSGEPVYNAIVWQDRRTADLCAALRETGVEEVVTRKTGLLLDPYFSATKIRWMLDHVEGAYEKARAGDLAFGTVDSFLLWHLTGGRVHATDATNASRTMLYNIHDGKWDNDLLDVFGVPIEIMPIILDNIAEYGHLDGGKNIQKCPIYGMAGDQQAALIGQGCFAAGTVKATYGTGCFALMNTGAEVHDSPSRMLATVAYQLGGVRSYALEGAIFNAGTAVQFLRDNLGLLKSADESEALAGSVEGTRGVYFVPAFTGLGAPHWRPDARGVLCGLGRDTQRAHIVRAVLEAQAYQTRDLLCAMERDGGFSIPVIRADGGLMANSFVRQFIADIMQRPVEVPAVAECTAWGAACLAGVGAGVFSNLDEATSSRRVAHRCEPQMDGAEADRLYAGWQKAVAKSIG
ncbi:MAG: glycerol kinase GlpK [Alphaproteobacteria bacterium]|nr:glycerol kinase GlpK [Alphaproteobacteria bacterium]MCB9975660.1 glycerol kinase GlpK [Rhodospirillales bacterium]